MTGSVPQYVECPDCGRMVTTAPPNRFMRHSTYPTGPLCSQSGRPVTADAVLATAHHRRAEQVMYWAQILRDEDPRRVWSWIKHADRDELNAMMMTALAALDPDKSLAETFGWVKGLAS